MRRGTQAERRQLGETFASLCRIESPSGRERECADWVVAELDGMGVGVEEDGAGAARAPRPAICWRGCPGAVPSSILLCAHLDTVPLTAPVEPVVVNGGWENSATGSSGPTTRPPSR